MNTKQIMTTAWTIAREGAKKFGGSVRSYIAAALRQAWIAARKPATLEDVADAANKLECVYRASVWNGRRVYINLTGFNPQFAGDKNLKVFFDAKLGWKVEGLKGNMSRAITSSLNAFAAAHGIAKAW